MTQQQHVSSQQHPSRREFLKTSLAATAGTAMVGALPWPAAPMPPATT